MRFCGWILLLSLSIVGCKSVPVAHLKQGDWRAELKVSETEVLPFTFKVLKNSEGITSFKVFNAEEVIKVDEITFNQDSIHIKMPVFEGYFAGKYTPKSIQGSFIKASLNRVVQFEAFYTNAPRFESNKSANSNISGIWEVTFEKKSGDTYPAKGIFKQVGNVVTGTFRTKTGDYRFLDGVLDGDQLKLSAFDGAHAFLFVATIKEDNLKGTFYSGNHYQEKFEAHRNADFELPDANSLTYLKEGYDGLAFSFPDDNNQIVSLNDAQFQNKVTLVQIMGTWCPNCLDETRFYVDYLAKNPSKDLKIVGLAFEYAKTQEKAMSAIKRLRLRENVPYPILLAQFGTSNKKKANEKLPMLNHVLSYPTTIFIDKKGKVRKIHTGFNGPATGEAYVDFIKDFESTLQVLLNE